MEKQLEESVTAMAAKLFRAALEMYLPINLTFN
jgi:hypothetical protein